MSWWRTYPIDMAADRPMRTESPVGRFCFVAAKPGSAVRGIAGRQVMLRCRITRPAVPPATFTPSVVAEGSPDHGAASGSWSWAALGGVIRTAVPTQTPFQTADWKTGGLLGLGHFGLKPDRSLIGASASGHKSVSVVVRVTTRICARRQEGLRLYCPSCPPKGGYNSGP